MTRRTRRDPTAGAAESPKIEVRREGAQPFSLDPELVQLLGKKSDGAVGRRAGLSAHAVGVECRRRGIPPFREQTPKTEWTPEMTALLGTDSDARIAHALGLTADIVYRRRRGLGIPPHHPERKPVAGVVP